MSAAYFLTIFRKDVRERRQMTREHDPRYCLIKSKSEGISLHLSPTEVKEVARKTQNYTLHVV